MYVLFAPENNMAINKSTKYISILIISILLTFIIFIKLNNKIVQPTKITAGPLIACPNENEIKILKKLSKPSLKSLAHCYDYSLRYLSNNNLILRKSKWLSHFDSTNSAKQFLIEALDTLGSQKQLHLELANIYVSERNWLAANEQINLAEVAVNEKIRLLIEGNIGIYSEGTDKNLLPYILRSQEIKHAQIINNQSSNFNLHRVSNGDVNTINGEPSMTTSSNGQNIWLVWTDSGTPTQISGDDFYWWKLKSTQSTDGGETWSTVNIDSLPNTVERFHFDPMTTYDETNNILYAGGSLVGYDGFPGSSNVDDSMFLYKWQLDNDSVSGPFKTFVTTPDKSWITAASDGKLYMAHRYGIDVSTDNGENFSRILNESFFAAHPRVKDGDCLIVTDIEKIVTCDNGELVVHNINFNSITANMGGDLVPGTFRVFPFVQNAIHNNGEIFVVYTDLKNSSSDELTIYMAKSNDNALTWSDPWVIAPDITGDQFIPWVEIDDQGGIHVIYYDTRNGNEPDTSPNATLDVYYSYSDDLGQTWQETRVTPTSFTTPELIWGDYFLTDYLSMSVANNQVYLAFPWSTEPNQMHMYFAKKSINTTDLIFESSFE